MRDTSRARVICKGQRYRALADLPVTVHTLWASPFSSSYERTLRAGEAFIAGQTPDRGAAFVRANAIAYRRLQREFVPLSDRLRFWAYSGYALRIAIGDVLSRCELLNPDEEFPEQSFERTSYAYEVDLNPVQRVNFFTRDLVLVRWFGKLRIPYSSIEGEIFQEQILHSGRMAVGSRFSGLGG